MKMSEVDAVVVELERVKKAAEDVKAYGTTRHGYVRCGTQYTAALKRASMDLTRALARLRKSC
jgi:hypothetical protein